MKLKFLSNSDYYLLSFFRRYPIRYIRKHFQQTYAKLSIQSTSFCGMIHDENEYQLLRNQMLKQPTAAENQIAYSIAKKIDISISQRITDPLVNMQLLKRQQRKNAIPPILMHYTYETLFAHYKSTIHLFWNNSFDKTPIREARLIAGTRNNKDVSKELVKKSPSS